MQRRGPGPGDAVPGFSGESLRGKRLALFVNASFKDLKVPRKIVRSEQTKT